MESNTGEQSFKIFQDIRINLDFWDRVKVLFNKKLMVYTTIETTAEVIIVKGYSSVTVDPWIKKKNKLGYSEQSDNRNLKNS